MNQYTLNFEPSLPERFPTLREYVAHRSTVVQKMPKTQAADMDMAPSTLSRKLNPSDGDTQRFNVDALVDAFGNVPTELMETGFSMMAPIQRMTSSLDSLAEPWPTPSSAPMPRRCISFTPSTSI